MTMQDIFDGIGPIRFEGPQSRHPLAYHYYDPDRMVLGKRMEDHLRVAVCYWHSFNWPGADIFGQGTFQRPWRPGELVTPDHAALKAANAFSFFVRLGVKFFCFHDVDVMAHADMSRDYVRGMASATELLADHVSRTGVKPLWGTANLFGHPRYAAGAATNPDPDVFAWACLQVREAMNATHALGGENYVLWGGREGYDTLLNTDLRQELDQLGRFMRLVVEHKHKTGFKGTILIEPKPHEPAKHQYDRDVATVYGFLKRYGLEDEIRVNIEANHATLAGHSFEHEIALAQALGIFGSIDMNRGDPQNGWDTDQFPNDLGELTRALYEILRGGGFTTGGFNFDAKVRRQSIDPADLFHAHVGGIDALARSLLAAAQLIERADISGFVDQRYSGWQTPAGRNLLNGAISLDDAATRAIQANLQPGPVSGRQEWLENLVTRAL
jgi:xylose isomerase